MNGRCATVALIALFTAGYAWNLGTAPFSDNDECRTGTIVRDMTEGGHWLLPRTPDGYPTEKPVACYGLGAAAAKAFGLNESSLRAVSLALAVGTLILTALLGELYGSARAGAFAVAALGSNFIFLMWARKAMVDMTLTFFLTAGLAAYFAARRGRISAKTAAILCGLSFGLAVLSKGPLGLALPIAAIGGDLLIATRGRLWRAAVPWGAGAGALAVIALVSAAWYVPAYLRGGREFLEVSVLSENFYMPLGKARGLGVSHLKPPYYYPLCQIATILPLLPLLPVAVKWLFSRDSGPARAHLLAWWGFGFLIFMIASNKRMYYLLPLQPACALMVGVALDERPPGSRRWAVLSGILLGLAALAAAVVLSSPSLFPSSVEPEIREAILQFRWEIVFFCGLVMAASLWLALAAQPELPAVAAALLCVAFNSGLKDAVDGRFNPTKDFVLGMAARVPRGVRPAILPPIHGYGVDFYWPERLARDEKAATYASYVFLQKNRTGEIPWDFEVVGTRDDDKPTHEIALIRRR